MLATRFIEEVGTRAHLRVYWTGACANGGTYHNAMAHLQDSATRADWKLGGVPQDYPEERWPTACQDCGAAVPEDRPWTLLGEEGEDAQQVHFQVFRKRLYNTTSGNPEPGDLYWADWYRCGEGGHCPARWTNCTGRHLFAVLPNGRPWDIDGRANNCTLREETTHRCWVRTGSPEAGTLDVGKGGHTCAAGAGSIAVPGYHGFLHHGHFTGNF